MQFIKAKHSMEELDLTCWYQPIYDVSNSTLLGYEALMRSKKYSTLNPMEVFQKAQLLGEHNMLDRHLIIKAQKLFKSQSQYPLFINIFPSTMLERDFIFWWDRCTKSLPNIILEISECEPIDNWQAFKLIIKELRERNVKIAIDDMGMGYSSLRHWIELEPDYIKLDRYYIMDIINNVKKQRIVEGLIDVIGDSAHIIFEGIEDNETLKLVKYFGGCYAQGYLLGMPSPITDIAIKILE